LSKKWLFLDIFHLRVNEHLGLQSHAEPTLRKNYPQNLDFRAIYFFSVDGYHTSAKKNSVPQQSSFIVLKFQRNRAKPELIRILFVTPLDLVDSRKDATAPQATEKHGHNTSGHFGKKMLELSPES